MRLGIAGGGSGEGDGHGALKPTLGNTEVKGRKLSKKILKEGTLFIHTFSQQSSEPDSLSEKIHQVTHPDLLTHLTLYLTFYQLGMSFKVLFQPPLSLPILKPEPEGKVPLHFYDKLCSSDLMLLYRFAFSLCLHQFNERIGTPSTIAI